MTKTLVERLRRADEYEPLGHDGWEAADRIEKLERENQDAIEAAFASKARIEKLEAALRPFADVADLLDSETEGASDTDEMELYLFTYLMYRLPVAEFRRARAALTPSPLPQQP